jgi:tetratricopeptide (TPR) repeat protein
MERTKMIPRSLLLIVLSVLSWQTGASQPLDNPTLHQLLRKGIDLSGQQKYSQAKAVFDEFIKKAPTHPAGYLNKAILYEVMSLDFETPEPMPEYQNLLDKAESLAQGLAAQQRTAADGNYYLGMVHSYTAYHKFRGGENWVSGLSHGMKALEYLNTCMKLNPKAYDAMTGVGTYKFWKSKKMSFLTWSTVVKDERALGIDLLLKAEKYASYSNAQATNSLIWIYIDEERYDDAIRIAGRILEKYPSNRLFLWGIASAAEKKKNWKLALSAYSKIVASIDGEVTERRYIELQARAKIALMSSRLGDKATAKRECAWVLSHQIHDLSPFTADGAERIKRRVDEMEELRKTL